jgi:hypothetical protein
MNATKMQRRNAKRIRKMYAWLCRQNDLEGAIRDMTNRSLREINGMLNGCKGGVPALIQGVILVEAADRFMNQRDEIL